MATKKSLEKFVKKASDAYYAGDQFVDDATFDSALKKLEKIDPKNDLVTGIGQDNSTEFKKRHHIMPMGSLAKAQNEADLKKWLEREEKRSPSTCFIVNHKLDGMSIELQYKNGKFRYAVTRGDGSQQGDDITANVIKMKGLAMEIPNFTGAVRGEIVMTKTMFNKRFPSTDYNRNIAIGMAKRPDGVGCKDLSIVVYDLWGNETIDTEQAKIEFLKEHFNFVAETISVSAKTPLTKIMKWYNSIIETRDDLDIAIDGLVIKCNEIDKKDMMREKPNRQLAFKFPPKGSITTLLGVEWSVSGVVYTPVALLKTVKIDGSNVSRASLCNPGIMKALGLQIGSLVSVVKRNDVIPKVESVVELGDGDEIEIPTVCKNCDCELICTDTKLYCSNDDCANKLLHQINKWINVNDIKEFGKKLIQMIYDNSLVSELAELYELDVNDLSELKDSGKKVGLKNATKAMDNLLAKKDITLSKFIAGFDILGIGERNIDILVAAGLDTLDTLRSQSVEDLVKVKGFGESKAQALVSGLKNHKEQMDNMLEHVQIMQVEHVEKTDVSVCFTGTLTIKRKEAEEMVKAKGGIVKKGVTGGLTYLVTDSPESGTKKNTDAQKLGVKIIGEKEFLKIFK